LIIFFGEVSDIDNKESENNYLITYIRKRYHNYLINYIYFKYNIIP